MEVGVNDCFNVLKERMIQGLLYDRLSAIAEMKRFDRGSRNFE